MAGQASSIAVCSWSLQPRSVEALVEYVRACGLCKVQLALDPPLENPAEWSDAGPKLSAAGIEIVSGMVGCVGEDYSSIDRIRQTGGVMPDDTWPLTIHRMRQAAKLAAELKIKLVTFHAGFIPHEMDSPLFQKGVSRIREAADVFAAAGAEIALETGQESAEAMRVFVGCVEASGVGINFDPANMLLYGSGEPTSALKTLLPLVRQVHIKDAIASDKPGTWGQEVPVGTGRVDWPAFFETLRSVGYVGNFVIEREAGSRRVDDILGAKELVARLV